MNQWLNRSHPPTLQAGVILGYISAVFGMLFGSTFPPHLVNIGLVRLLASFFIVLLTSAALGVGAFATANNKRWGYTLLALAALTYAGIRLLFVVLGISAGVPISLPVRIEFVLKAMNVAVFPTALAAAVIHVQSREYQKVWFE